MTCLRYKQYLAQGQNPADLKNNTFNLFDELNSEDSRRFREVTKHLVQLRESIELPDDVSKF